MPNAQQMPESLEEQIEQLTETPAAEGDELQAQRKA